MQTDLLLMPFGATYAQMREAAVTAEDAGFDGIWTWDHLRDADYNSGRVPEALVTLPASPRRPPRVMLGTLVLNVANRHPGLLANMAATLQEVSGNRFILGLGAGGGPSLPYAPRADHDRPPRASRPRPRRPGCRGSPGPSTPLVGASVRTSTASTSSSAGRTATPP